VQNSQVRHLQPFISEDLKRKMVFVAGPRQCGKTTLAKAILSQQQGRYYNWGDDDDRRSILKKNWDDDQQLLVFDELHKFARWKNWIKGVFDTQGEHHQILVTGSARLHVYRRGGDSLLGRYHHWRLHPFTIDERPMDMPLGAAFDRLLAVGGFPEPFLSGNLRAAKRWRRDREDRVLRDDLRELENVQKISPISLLVSSLKERVGSLIVANNLAGDLQVSPTSVKHWLTLLENMYLLFVVPPYTNGVPRAIQKPPKVYFFDNADVIGSDAVKFKNLVATHLLKWIHFLEDSDGDRYALHHLRDKEGHEVDFVITKNRKLLALIDVHLTAAEPSPSLRYFATRMKPTLSLQIVATAKKRSRKDNIETRGIDAFESNFLADLNTLK
jgi:uncharacterized protein